MTNRLRIWIKPSAETNDHEARLEIDGGDWLGQSQLGLDPPDLLRQLSKPPGSNLTVGRCDCGCLGCCDVAVRLHRHATTVEWRSETGPLLLVFDAAQYDSEVARFSADHTWEDTGRTVERLVEEIFSGSKLKDDLSFEWASTRIKPGLVHLSFSGVAGQHLLEFSWDGVTVESALRRGRQLHDEYGLTSSDT